MKEENERIRLTEEEVESLKIEMPKIHDRYLERIKTLENRYLMLEKWMNNHQELHNAIERGD